MPPVIRAAKKTAHLCRTGSLPVIDDDPGGRFNHYEITKLLQGFRESIIDGSVQVVRIIKGAVLRELATGVHESFDDWVIGPQDPPRKSTMVIKTWSNIKVW